MNDETREQLFIRNGTKLRVPSTQPNTAKPTVAIPVRLGADGLPIGADREAGILYGMVLAEAGPFKSNNRGQFDLHSLLKIVRLAKDETRGLKSRLGHPAPESPPDSFLGRVRRVRLDDSQSPAVVRGDLHFSAGASRSPRGDLMAYVLAIATEDDTALNASLDLSAKQTGGTSGPPLWLPQKLWGVDLVDFGDATNSLLNLPPAPKSRQWYESRLRQHEKQVASDRAQFIRQAYSR